MIRSLRSTLLFALLGSCTSVQLVAGDASPPRVLYLYGDVSEEGHTPAGDQPPFHPMRLNDSGQRGMSQFKEAIESLGIQLEEAYDAGVKLNDDFLASYQALILASNQRRFSTDEARAVGRWVGAGGGLIVWSDSAFGGHYKKVGLDNTRGRDSDNDLIRQFGMFMLTDNGGGNYLVTEFTEPHYLNANQVTGGPGYRGEGVSPIRVSPPARLLAPLQAGGLGGKIKVNPIDAPFNPETDAALAIAEVGEGRVVGTFDRNTFWNAGEGTRLSHAGNREFAQRLVLWAIRREDTPIPGTNAPHLAKELRVNAGPDRTIRTGEIAHLAGSVATNGQPEFQWKVTRGTADAVSFENNNSSALDNHATFKKSGIYVLELEALLGEIKAADKVTITVKD